MLEYLATSLRMVRHSKGLLGASPPQSHRSTAGAGKQGSSLNEFGAVGRGVGRAGGEVASSSVGIWFASWFRACRALAPCLLSTLTFLSIVTQGHSMMASMMAMRMFRVADVLRSSLECECIPVLKNPVADDLIYSLALTTPLAFFLNDDHAAHRGPHLDPSFGVSVVGHCQSHRRHYVVVYGDYYLVCYLGITSPCGGRPLVVLARGRSRTDSSTSVLVQNG
jgi:hypothetical protein